MMKKLQMSKEAFDMAKGAFRKVFKKHKSEAKRTKKTKGLVPTVPYDLKKADVKKTTDSKTKPKVKKTKPVAKKTCLLYTSPSPRDRTRSRMPSSA